jgi:multicomponent Na+:H+ antiporter subunit C
MEAFDGVTVAILLFAIGIVAITLRRDLIIKLLALGLLNASTILLLISVRSTPSDRAPILPIEGASTLADPLPQALVLSAIVINFAILALSLVFVMLLVERYHTTDSARIERDVLDEEEAG